MKKIYLILLIFSAVMLAQEKIETDFFYGYLAGKYHLIGKEIEGDGTYLGEVEIVNRDTLFEIRRTINGKTIFGKGILDYTKHEDIPFLRVNFTDDGVEYEASYLWQSDFDNYARISGYLYKPGERTEDPGLEVMFTNRHPAPEKSKEAHMIKGLRTVKYGVTDLDKGKEWYSEVLGIKPYFDEPFYVGFNVDGYELGLDPDSSAVGSGDAGVVAYWGVDDIEKEYNRLLSIGAKSHSEIMDVGGGIKVATVLDPFGNVFGIIYNPHFKK